MCILGHITGAIFLGKQVFLARIHKMEDAIVLKISKPTTEDYVMILASKALLVVHLAEVPVNTLYSWPIPEVCAHIPMKLHALNTLNSNTIIFILMMTFNWTTSP